MKYRITTFVDVYERKCRANNQGILWNFKGFA